MKKNILVSGLPHSGKSTLLRNAIQDIPDKVGFLTNEVLDNGARIGFEIETHSGRKSVLAGISPKTPFRVSRYFVSPENLLPAIKEVSHFGKNSLLYLDEIGQMELLCPEFRDAVLAFLDAPNFCIASISSVYSDPFIEAVKKRRDVILIEITPQDRDEKGLEVRQILKSGLGGNLRT